MKTIFEERFFRQPVRSTFWCFASPRRCSSVCYQHTHTITFIKLFLSAQANLTVSAVAVLCSQAWHAVQFWLWCKKTLPLYSVYLSLKLFFFPLTLQPFTFLVTMFIFDHYTYFVANLVLNGGNDNNTATMLQFTSATWTTDLYFFIHLFCFCFMTLFFNCVSMTGRDYII